MSYQVYQLAALVARALGGRGPTVDAAVQDFLITVKTEEKKPTMTVEEATQRAYDMFAELIAAADANEAGE